MIASIAQVIFFLTVGLSYFFPFAHSGLVIAIAALVVGIISLGVLTRTSFK